MSASITPNLYKVFNFDIEFIPHLFLVDHDLGDETGADVMEAIFQDPDFRSTSIFLYSGGESIETLTDIINKMVEEHLHTLKMGLHLKKQ